MNGLEKKTFEKETTETGRSLEDVKLIPLEKISTIQTPETLNAIINAAAADIQRDPHKVSQKYRALNNRILAAEDRLREITDSGSLNSDLIMDESESNNKQDA